MTKFGYHQTSEHIEKRRIQLAGKKRSEIAKRHYAPSKLLNNNPMWRGNDVGYSGVHQWVRRHLPKPESCESCGRVSKWIDLANITGIYSREFENWRYLCRKCHRKNDGPTHIRDMSGFRCCICGSEKTVIVKQTGRPHWRYLDGKPICQTCYGRILKLRNKK